MIYIYVRHAILFIMISSYDDKADLPKNKSKEREFKPPKKISARYLHNSGLAYLQRFPASSSHFRSIMMRKINKSCRAHEDQETEECAALLDELILKFQDLKLLDDDAYLKGMITSLRHRGLSARQIESKLAQKGMQGQHVHDALRHHDEQKYNSDESGDFFAAIIFARKKRFGAFDIEGKRDPEKSLASMARAGYSYQTIKKTLGMPKDELEYFLKQI